MDFNSVTVIIPNLHSPIIDRVIAALRNQQWLPPNFEILVVGLDKHQLVQDDAVVRLISTGVPASPARARNIGWRAARHQCIVFMDADCIPRPDWFCKMGVFLQAHPDAGAVLSGMDFESNKFWTVCDQIAAFHEHMYWKPSGPRLSLPSYALFVPKVLLMRIGGFDESFTHPAAEDLDLTVRIKLLHYETYINTEAVVTHQPQRQTLRALWRHGFWSGHESIKVRLRYRDVYRMPSWARHAWAWRLLALPIALVKTTAIMAATKTWWRYLLCLPFVFLAKVAWCLGAAASLDTV